MQLGSQETNFSDIGAAKSLTSLDQARATGDDKDVSVLFSDISGYTKLIKTLESEELADLLSDYFDAMVQVVSKYKQTLNQQLESACIANRIITLFGSPLPLPDHAWIALKTAREMCDRLASFNENRLKTQKPEIKIGIGINSDRVNPHAVGATQGMEFMAIGAGVHLSYRLEGVCKQYGCKVVLSENTYKLCQDRIWIRKLDSIRLQGNNRPAIAIYEFLGFRNEPISDQKQQVIEHYDKGREYYLNKKFAIAMGEFATVMEIDSSDKAAAIQLARCQHWLKSPPTEEWDGSWTIGDS